MEFLTTSTNLNRLPVCFTIRGPQGHRVVNITAIALSLIVFGAQVAVRIASHAKLGSLHVIFVTLTIIVSILLICIAVYNLFHLCVSVRQHRDEKGLLHRRVRDLEIVERELNRQLQEQRLELDCLREEIIAQFNRAEHSEGRFSEDLHQLGMDKAKLEQQLQSAKEEIVNLSRELESRLEDVSMEIELPSSDEEEDEDTHWFEANNILGSPVNQRNIDYMVMQEDNADDEASTSSEHEASK
ncbi:hypothetical protein SBV42_00905 [Chlamydia crocodili]|uniref:IncA family protein n=1 Tax=Chlamydia crocodili TaxID=2766982 RepID=A0ABX8CE93_9CHLA|nr:hypothetical protein [Chlamydia crocodili]QVE49329.1 hypothetical protein H9Q19_01285 [Chlamydia crocodili]